MQEWWLSLSLFEKTLWLITLPVSVIFLIQMALTFLGMDSHGETDTSMADDTGYGDQPFQLFTFRNFINFLLGFGWTAISLNPAITNKFILVGLSAFSGIILVAAVLFIFYSMARMQQSGNMNIHNALHQTGEVYLTIPSAKTGSGKVHVKIQGTLREINAITDGERILTGRQIKVVQIINEELLLVEPI